MDPRQGYDPQAETYPHALRYCKVCRQVTPHEIRAGAGLTAKMCVKCLESGRNYELDSD